MLKRLFLVAFAFGLFFLVLRQVDLHKSLLMLQQADLKLCLLAFLSFMAMVYLKGIRWSFLLKMQGHSYSVWNCFLIYMGTLTLGSVTPGRAGDFAKVFYLKQDLNIPIGRGITSVLVDRVFDLYLLLILGCLGLMTYPMPPNPALIHSVWAFFGLLILVSLLAFNRQIGEALMQIVFQKVMGSRMKEKSQQSFKEFHEGMESFYKPALIVPVLLSLAAYVIFFFGCQALATSLGMSISVLYIAFCISVVNITSLVTFLGMGAREETLIILLGLLSYSKDQAFDYSLLLLIVGTIFISIVGLLCFWAKPISLKGILS